MKKDIQGPEDVKRLVDLFYEHASSDSLLGPIFFLFKNRHADKKALYKYWENTLLHSGSEPKRSFPKHIERMFSAQHFMRWLTLFLQTIDQLYEGPNATKAKVIVIRKSEEFQSSLELSRF